VWLLQGLWPDLKTWPNLTRAVGGGHRLRTYLAGFGMGMWLVALQLLTFLARCRCIARQAKP
jgi:type IV secretory pathway TrbD component